MIRIRDNSKAKRVKGYAYGNFYQGGDGMKHLGAKAARFSRTFSAFARGLVIGAILVIALNSYGYVIQVGVVPNTIQMTEEAMR